MTKFKVGQSVRVKGQPNSPIMTIYREDPNGRGVAYCTFWKTDTNCFKREQFEGDCVELVPENELQEIIKKALKL
jgi:uncharacterized protein YodC (DUF2158 family)